MYDYEFELLSNHDLGGHGDGMQVQRHGDALYVGHLGTSGMGTSILDVADPGKPRLAHQWKAPPNTHTHKVQVADGLLLVNHESFPYKVPLDELPGPPSTGMAIYSLADPFQPKQIGFWNSTGRGVHRIVYMGGRYAYLSAVPDGFESRMWIVVDILDPANPVEVGRWWWPGQWIGGGEIPSWDDGANVRAHHALIDGDTAFLSYDEYNLVVLDIADRAHPVQIGGLTWPSADTHTCLPLPGRNLLAVTDEQLEFGPSAPDRTIRLIDISDKTAPSLVSVVDLPPRTYFGADARFGAHNLHENRPHSYQSEVLIFATFFNGGLCLFDIRDPLKPLLVRQFVPAPGRGQKAAQSNDVFVDESGLVYVSDRVGGGVSIVEPNGPMRDLMEQSAL